jgi:hypothetical protein
MSQIYKYFMIPFENVPKEPTYTVWFGTWSQGGPGVTWSKERPESNTDTTWVVGLTADEPPSEATIIGSSTKDPPPPPPESSTTNLSDYQQSFAALLSSRGAS